MPKEQKQPAPKVPNPAGWLSWCLTWPSLAIFLTIDVALAITVIVLAIISSKNDGFVTIPSQNSTSKVSDQGSTQSEGFNISWDLGILWTSLPSFAFSLFGAYWAWIAGSIAERQPYIELRKAQGAPARTSVLLDYRVVASIWRWWGAFRKKHFMVGSTTLLSVFLTYAVAPFAAQLFVPRVVGVSKPTPVAFNVALNDQAINSTLDWRPILDTVAASLLHDGNNLPWTDNEHAFCPFAPNGHLTPGTDVAANTMAYSAYLNCELVEDYSISSSTDGDGWSISISGTDRGCDFKQSFGVADTQEIYFKTTSQIDCSSAAYYSRLVFTAAKFSSSAENKLDDVSVISCATGYRQVTGLLRVTPTSSSPLIRSFAAGTEPDTSRPSLWRVFEQGVLGPTSFNPQTKWSSSDMGSLILYYTQKQQPTAALESKILIEGITKVFTAIYMNAIAMHGFESRAEPEISTGTAFIPKTRLFVVPWVSYIIIAFLAITLASVISVFLHIRKNPSILTEEPQGLLSMAGILDGSELLAIATQIRQEPDFDGETRKRGKARTDVKDGKWGAEKDPSTNNWVIKCIREPESGLKEELLSPAPESTDRQVDPWAPAQYDAQQRQYNVQQGQYDMQQGQYDMQQGQYGVHQGQYDMQPHVQYDQQRRIW